MGVRWPFLQGGSLYSPSYAGGWDQHQGHRQWKETPHRGNTLNLFQQLLPPAVKYRHLQFAPRDCKVRSPPFPGQFDTWRAQGAVEMNSLLWGWAVCVGVQQGCHSWSWHCSNWCGRANLPWNQETSQECSTLPTVNSERVSAYHLPIYGEFLFSCLWATSLSTVNIHFVLLRPWVIDETQSVSDFRTERGSWRKPVNTLHPLMSMTGSVMDTWPEQAYQNQGDSVPQLLFERFIGGLLLQWVYTTWSLNSHFLTMWCSLLKFLKLIISASFLYCSVWQVYWLFK